MKVIKGFISLMFAIVTFVAALGAVIVFWEEISKKFSACVSRCKNWQASKEEYDDFAD